MYRKFNNKEIVNIIWDCRDIPEYIEELTNSELKQIESTLQIWSFEIQSIINEKFIESEYSIEVWEKLKTENLFNGFSLVDVDFLRGIITNKLDPVGLIEFRNALYKLSDEFNYKFPTTKYTIIYHYLNTELKSMPLSKEDYFKEIRNGKQFDLKGKVFSRLSFDDYTDKRYQNNLKELMRIMDN